MPTCRAVRDEVDSFLEYLMTAEIALYRTPVSMIGTRVAWHPSSSLPMRTPRGKPTTLDDYLNWLDTGHYSAILLDGALLQLSYEVQGNTVVGHRLSYVPCPFDLDRALLVTEPIGDVVRLYAARPDIQDVLLSGAVRFDYDPQAARPGHPATHLTLNSHECRIACHSPVRIGNFADFIIRNFYWQLWLVHPYFAGMPRGEWGVRTLTDDEARYMHVAWSA